MLIQNHYSKINFTANLDRQENTKMVFIIEEAKETILDFSYRNVKVLWIFFTLIWYRYKMNQYNTLNVKLSNLQLNKLQSGIKNGTEVIFKTFIKRCWWF